MPNACLLTQYRISNIVFQHNCLNVATNSAWIKVSKNFLENFRTGRPVDVQYSNMVHILNGVPCCTDIFFLRSLDKRKEMNQKLLLSRQAVLLYSCTTVWMRTMIVWTFFFVNRKKETYILYADSFDNFRIKK